jgi:SAM-dependent methyltransferase
MRADVPYPFTAHNIRLDDGTSTITSDAGSMDEHALTLGVKRVLHVLYPEGLTGKTIVDVGCLEGGYTTAFARMGMTATGIEVRDSNFKNCIYVRDRVNLPNLNFIQGDANDIAKFGAFDVFFVSGLLYHLDRPRQFLEQVAQNCRKALILWTHISHAHQSEASRHYNLSPLAENERLHGRWYADHDDVSKDTLDGQLKWASWGNNRSFWIQKEFLLDLLREIGFDLVFEQFDQMEEIVTHMTGEYNKFGRVVLVAVKTGLPAFKPTRAIERSGPAIEKGFSDTLSELVVTKAALAKAESELAAIRNSSSWRVTQPLRRAVERFRGS